MATSIHRIDENCNWRTESTTPTADSGYSAVNRFDRIDPERDEIPDGSGGIRKFYWMWTGWDIDTGATMSNQREAFHTYELSVYYPRRVMKFPELKRLMMQDRHDLLEELRTNGKNVDNRLGWDANNTTDDIGLIDRICTGGAIVEEDKFYILRFNWRLFIREDEL